MMDEKTFSAGRTKKGIQYLKKERKTTTHRAEGLLYYYLVY